MHILLCPDKFKGSLSSDAVCQALSSGIAAVYSEARITSIPMADGGDGSVDILRGPLGLQQTVCQTVDPLGRPLTASYYHKGETAYIELASASGLALLSADKRNPMLTSTLGTGLLMKDSVDRGFTTIYLLIGGSATNDAGTGIAKALGYDFLDRSGNSLSPTGEHLAEIKKIKRPSQPLAATAIHVLCDVTNPMHGPHGAAHTYAAQKGADKRQIELLDAGLELYGALLDRRAGHIISDLPGMGAAGAVSVSLVGLLGAHMLSGVEQISTIVGLENAIQSADLVITGEGKVDQTSKQGKVAGHVAQLCEQHRVPFGLVAGSLERDIDLSPLCRWQYAITDQAKSIEEAIKEAHHHLVQIGKRIGARLLGDQ